MAALIDSSVFIDVEHRRLSLEDLLTERAGEEVALAVITASELIHGVHRATKAKHRALWEAFVESVLANVAIIPFDLVTARIHARL
jgi:predicted nucleic acid-binding protein